MNKALLAFTGKPYEDGRDLESQAPLRIRIKDSPAYVIIDFAEIRAPTHFVKADLQAIADKFDVVVLKDKSHVKVFPRFAYERLEKDGVLATIDEELCSNLEEWFKANAKKLVAELLGLAQNRKV